MEYLTLFALFFLTGYLIGRYQKVISIAFFEMCDISFAYTKFVLLHRWNKLNERHIRFIEEADWTFGSETKHKILVKIKKLNQVK
jgi:hypothetical protein